MGRAITFKDADVFAALAQRMTREGSLAVQSLVEDSGISIGSLYHRYGSREGLMASAWLDAVETFQTSFLAALGSGRPSAGLDAALATPRFCRAERDRALILVACRKSEFLGENTPQPLREQIRDINQNAMVALRAFSKAHSLDLETCQMAMIGLPLGAVRLYLPDRNVPMKVDAMLKRTYEALLPMA